MNTNEAKATFNQMADTFRAAGDMDRVARIELAREFFTNPDFRKALEDHLWKAAA